MAEPFVGQIEAFAFDFAPRGWAVCAGQTLPISQNQALFALIGTTFGGNGSTTFALPDLRGSAAMGQGAGPGLTPRTVGQVVGEESHTLTVGETPAHQHSVNVISNPDTTLNVATPANTVVLSQTTGLAADGQSLNFDIYAADAAPSQSLNPAVIGTTGGQPHTNLMPLLAVNFCIALSGIFPPRN